MICRVIFTQKVAKIKFLLDNKNILLDVLRSFHFKITLFQV